MIKILLLILSLHLAASLYAQVPTTVKDSTDNITEAVADTLLHPSSADTLSTDSTRNGAEQEKLPRKSSGLFPTGDLRSVDGLFIGLGYKISEKATEANPNPSYQKISAMKNLKSEALQFKYKAEWFSVFNKTDFIVDAFVDLKGNILNFFGRGNETPFDQSLDFRTFYRVKFSLFQVDPAFRINFSDKLSLNIGPSFQLSRFSHEDNTERFINQPVAMNQFENLHQQKSHGGLLLALTLDKRDDKLLPTKGLNFYVLMQGYGGLNKYSRAFSQIFPQLSFYKSLDAKGRFVLADRVGGGVTFGTTEFYQSAFLGSQDNLLGYRKFRFAGDHVLYNNLEARLTLLDSYGKKLPLKMGLIGFYDAGRVWIENEDSGTIHQGYGGGAFLSPMNRLLFRVVAGFSEERMQTTVAIRQRF